MDNLIAYLTELALRKKHFTSFEQYADAAACVSECFETQLNGLNLATRLVLVQFSELLPEPEVPAQLPAYYLEV